MTREARIRSAVDRYWDALALTGRAPETDDLERETADLIDRLWALSAPPDAHETRERVWRRLQAPDTEAAVDGGVFGMAVDAMPLSPEAANGRVSHIPPSRHRPVWRRGLAGQFATVALLALVLAASLFAAGPLRPAGDTPDLRGILRVITAPVAPGPAGPLAEFLWQASGDPDLALWQPVQPAIDPAGNLWVADAAKAHSRLLMFDPSGAFLEAWGARGSGEGEFAFSCSGVGLGGVAFDAAGNIYVADSGNQRVQKFGPDRAFITSWGSAGTADDQFLCPAAVAVDPQGRVYVADHGWGVVKVFASDGAWLATWSGLVAPIGIAVAADDTVWVADADGGIAQFSAAGERLTDWDISAVGDDAVNEPTGIAVDAQGRVYVADAGANRVQVFAPDGTVLGGWGARGEEAGQFQEPRGIALDGDGDAYIADFYGERVQKFRLLPPLTP